MILKKGSVRYVICTPLTHYIIELCMYLSCNYYYCYLIIDVRATELLHNEDEEEVKGDDRCGTREALKAESKILGMILNFLMQMFMMSCCQ